MSEFKSKFRGVFKTVGDVENRINLALTDIDGGKLQGLQAIGEASKHVTEATFEETLGKPKAKGDLTFKLANGGTNTAWINGEKIKVSFS